ncbi:MAG: GNAT family N-acetyltransferase [Burkholderiaceae bacterium]|nr:GNAT family N-acetyltransferase [Burkholderiaceae bacterium]
MPLPTPRRLRRALNHGLRVAFSWLPRRLRFALIRGLVECDPAPPPSLVLKIAETREELEACFALLHDAYVASGFMKPHPSGLRVTPYHALPTTTTICALVDGRVVGTLSMVRESVFGLPLQSAFDLGAVRARGGQIAEISALAVHPDHRRTGGTVLFPLMKFMYEYCTRFFETRHLVIAVNPNRIELYEALLQFERLPAEVVESYDFANGAPAVGASLDLDAAPAIFERLYGGKAARRNLHAYFTQLALPNLRMPPRRYFTTNDPVMTPALLDHFFRQRTSGFADMTPRQWRMLHAIYDRPDYAVVLPPMPDVTISGVSLRRHPRHAIRFPAVFTATRGGGRWALVMREISLGGCQVELASAALPPGAEGELMVQLGAGDSSVVQARVLRTVADGVWSLQVKRPDDAWRRCVQALEAGETYRDVSRSLISLSGAARAV